MGEAYNHLLLFLYPFKGLQCYNSDITINYYISFYAASIEPITEWVTNFHPPTHTQKDQTGF